MSQQIVKAEILPPSTHELRMPAGTPLGLGILGAARFGAMRRVLEHASRAAYAKAELHHGEASVARALVGREIAREQLRNVDVLCEEEAERIKHATYVAGLHRRLERMELEDQLAEREGRRTKLQAQAVEAKPVSPAVADEFQAFLSDLKKMPDIMKAVADVKSKIVENAGGAEKLSEADQISCDMLDGMMQAFMSKKTADAVL